MSPLDFIVLCLSFISPSWRPPVTKSQRADLSRPPSFCHGLDCPVYEVKKRYAEDTIELRSYESSTWASTHVKGKGYDTAIRAATKLLAAYFNGTNENGTLINTTVPVKVRCVLEKGGFYTKNDYVVSFMIPFVLQDEPPVPTSKDIYVEQLAPSEYFVKVFDGYTDGFKLAQEASNLYAALDDYLLDYDGSHFYWAGYDAPTTFKKRHNEVWAAAVPSPEPSKSS